MWYMLKRKCYLKLSHVALITVIWVQQFCIITTFKIMEKILSLEVSQPPKTGEKTADWLFSEANATAQKVNCLPNFVVEP